MKYKVGDRVFIDGEKFTVNSINNEHVLSLDIFAESESERGYSVCFSSSDDEGIKPIITVKAQLGDKHE